MSLKRMTLGRWGTLKTSRGGLISKELSNSGYLRVSLCKDGSKKRFTIHRLVASAFIDNPDNKRCVNHLDGNKVNNTASNLEWCTHKENRDHAVVTGLVPPLKIKLACKVTGCEKPIISKQLCSHHYTKARWAEKKRLRNSSPATASAYSPHPAVP